MLIFLIKVAYNLKKNTQLEENPILKLIKDL